MWQVLGTFFWLVLMEHMREAHKGERRPFLLFFLPAHTYSKLLNLLCTPYPSHLRIIGPQISPFTQQKPVSATQAMIYYEKVLYLKGAVS